MGFFNKIKDSAVKAADKAKDSVEVVRLNSQIATKRKEIEKLYLQIGEAVFEAYQANELSIAEQLIHKNSQIIVTLQTEIEEIEVKVRALKDEKDCVCGQVLTLDAKFCSSCGHRFEEQAVVAVSKEVVNAVAVARISNNDQDEPVIVQEVVEADNVVQVKKQCPACQSELQLDDQFCENCGEKQ